MNSFVRKKLAACTRHVPSSRIPALQPVDKRILYSLFLPSNATARQPLTTLSNFPNVRVAIYINYWTKPSRKREHSKSNSSTRKCVLSKIQIVQQPELPTAPTAWWKITLENIIDGSRTVVRRGLPEGGGEDEEFGAPPQFKYNIKFRKF